MNRVEANHNDENEQKDDLQVIKGIGKSIAKALRELGIQDYTALAESDPHELMEKLSGKLPSIALLKAVPEDWVREARALAGRETRAAGGASSYPEPISRKALETGSTVPPSRSGWQEIADFFLSFGYWEDERGESQLMTRVHHSQADRQVEWRGIPSRELLRWLGEQAGLPELIEAGQAEGGQAATPEPAAGQAETIRVSLSNLWVSEVGVPVTGNREEQASLLRVSSTLALSGEGSDSYVGEQIQFAVDILLVNTETNQPNLVGTYSSRLSPEQHSYPVQQDFQIPGPGRYQLYLMARMPPPAEAVKFVQGPIIVVEG